MLAPRAGSVGSDALLALARPSLRLGNNALLLATELPTYGGSSALLLILKLSLLAVSNSPPPLAILLSLTKSLVSHAYSASVFLTAAILIPI